MKLYTVIDTETGSEPDLERIAIKESWAKDLTYCDMDGFAVGPEGELYLLDEDGNYKCCPPGRFQVVWLVQDQTVDERDQT